MHSEPAILERVATAEMPAVPALKAWTRDEVVALQDGRDRVKRFMRVYKTIPRDIKKDERNRYILMVHRAALTLSKRQFNRVAWPWLPTRPPQKQFPNWDRIRRNTRPGAR